MKAMVMRAVGAPEVLQLEDLPVPVPGEREVLVKTLAVGVSYHDVVQRNGTMRRDVKLPMVLGYEVAGVVEAVGSAVTTLKKGDHVCTKAFSSCGLCRLCRNGMETACANRVPIHGGYAEYVALPEEACVNYPHHIAPEVACMLGATTGVALNAVRDVGKVRIGETVLITGASGGVGLAALDIAKLAGASTIAVTRSEAKKEFLLRRGASHVVIAAPGEDFSKQVRSISGQDGVDLVVDTVGSSVFTASFKSLCPGGRYAMVGQLTGDVISINPAFIFFRRAQILGVGSVRRDQLQDVVRLVGDGKLQPKVDRVLPLEEATQAHRIVEEGRNIGRVVLAVLEP